MTLPETINAIAFNKLTPVKLPSTYRIDRSMGAGCYGDPPGYPSYYIQHVYTQYGNSPRKGAESVIFGRVLQHSKDWDGCKNWDEYQAKFQKRLRGLWNPLPLEHPRTRAWMAATIKHHAHCYQSPESQAAGKWETVIFPVPYYKLKAFTDDPRFSDEWRTAAKAEVEAYNADIIERASKIATIDNHDAVILIRRYYPEWTPTTDEATAILAGEVPPGYDDSTGNWWETESERPTPENCNPRSLGPHPVNGNWCQWCGWKLTDVEPWDQKEAKQLRAGAIRLFKCENRSKHRMAIERENCGACVLRGYISQSARTDGIDPNDGPNYAGWARVYVQAGEPIPEKWRAAFDSERHSKNEAYAMALERDLATFGVTFK